MPKKKTALTIEERLQQALVPAEEQPYEVPENWVWVRLGAVCYASKEKSNDFSNEIKYIGLEHLEKDKGIVGFSSADKVKSTKNAFQEGQILYGRLRPYLNKHDIASFSGVCSTDILVFEASVLVANVLVDKFFNLPFFIEYVVANSKGINLPRVSEKTILNTTFPLPPLSEQQRIVERIEELFAKLDEAKERLQEVAESFAVRKAAILHKAFTGELTKKHEIEDSIVIRDKLFAERENMVQEKVLKRVKIKPLIQDEYKSQFAKNWVQCKLGEVAFVTKLAGFEYTKYIHLEDTGEIPVVRAQNVRKGYLDTTNLLYISKSVSDALSRSALKEKSVLITFIGAGIGDACVFDENQQYHLAPNVAKVEPFNKSEEKLNVYFLLYYLLSSFGQYEIFKNMKATAQPSLSMETIREIIIPLPSIEEQHEIVRLIDDLLARERAAQQATEQALASIDPMKKSILARAFRGELGTNKASEASALELLKQVLAEN